MCENDKCATLVTVSKLCFSSKVFLATLFLPAFPIHFPMQIKSNSTLHFPLHYIHLVENGNFCTPNRNPKLFFMISDYGNLTLDKEEKIRHTSSTRRSGRFPKPHKSFDALGFFRLRRCQSCAKIKKCSSEVLGSLFALR